MTAPTVWGTLAKAQDDSTTIDAAIAAAISAHNEDPTAHMDTGQSIEVHRTNDVLDHPVGAVLADKHSNTELVINDPLSTLDPWTITGDVSVSSWPSVGINVERGVTNKSEMGSNPQFPAPFLTKLVDTTFQVMATFNQSNTHIYAWLGLCTVTGSTPAPNDGYGFYVADGTLKAFSTNAGTPTYVTIGAIVLGDTHVYRAQLNVGESTIYFYIDGVQVASIAVPATDWASDSGPHMGAYVAATNDGNLFVSDVRFSRSLI